MDVFGVFDKAVSRGYDSVLVKATSRAHHFVKAAGRENEAVMIFIKNTSK